MNEPGGQRPPGSFYPLFYSFTICKQSLFFYTIPVYSPFKMTRKLIIKIKNKA